MAKIADVFVDEVIFQGSPRFVTLAESDSTVLTGIRWLYVGGAGNVVVTNEDDTDVTFTAVPAGTRLDISPKKLKVATTATLIVAVY
jgi:hypothetical protein